MSEASQEFEHEEASEELHELEDTKREDDEDEEEEREVDPQDNVAANYEGTKIVGLEDQGGDEDGDDDDDDENEDGDEDDDEIEDRARSRKRRRRERNQFLDVEAEVSDDDEEDEEEDDDLAKEGFIAPEHEHDNEPVAVDDRLHRQVDRFHEKSTEEDAQKLADEFKERYGRSNKYRGEDSGVVSQRFLLPSINDPSIWAIRCRPGKEKELVRKLLKKKLTLAGKPNELKILSAFQRDNFTGYIYIEAEKLTAVDVAIRGIPDIYSANKVLVPVEEFPDLLRASRSTEVKVTPGSYVRIKRGKYKGDLAIVDSIEESGLEITLQIVPRLNYKASLDIDEDTGKRKRESVKFRPPQRLFSKKEALENDPNSLVVRSSNTFSYKGEEYIDGFLFKLFKLQFLETQNVQPTLEEVSKFNTGDSDELDLTSIAQSLRNSSTVIFRTGDRVQVLQGEQQGLIGDVVSSSNDVVLVKPTSFTGGNLEFPVSNLRKIFTEGDHVSVLKGKFASHTGIVVSINNDQVTFISDQSHKDVTVFANYLTKSEDTSTIVDGKYGLQDLVRINATTYGVIIRADKDIFNVLSQEGKVLPVKPSSIIEKIIIPRDQDFAMDSLGEPIKVGDTVKENQGLKRQGKILHIYRSTLFIFSKEIIENQGIFVSDISSVAGIASKNRFTEKREELDLTKMNPRVRAGAMAPPPVPVRQLGRDKTINQSVSIRLGEYKGYRGIVKDTNGDIARVELHTKNKILSISKSKLAFVDKNNNLIPYEEFISNRAGDSRRSGSSNSQAPSFSSNGNSSSWGGSSQRSTPSGGSGWANYGGSKTPLHGGRTAVGSHGAASSWGGGGASAWGGNAGGASAWGGNAGGASAWGGNAGGASAWGGNAGGNSSWGGNGGNGSSWGGNAGGASAWGSNTAGGASAWRAGNASAWGGNTSTDAESTTEGTSAYGGGSSWGNTKKTTTGAGSQWGNRSAWNAATPGNYQTAETPGSHYDRGAPTPYETAQTPYGSAPTPAAAAATPGAYTYNSDNE